MLGWVGDGRGSRRGSVSYAGVGYPRHLFIAARRAPLCELVFPSLGILFLGYTIYRNVAGQVFPYSRFWIVVAAWLLVGLAIILASPRLAARIGTSLAADEGLTAGPD